MQNAKKLILLAVMFSAVTIGLCLAKSLPETTWQRANKALQLLDEYAQTQDKLQKSFVIKEEYTIVTKANWGIAKGYRKYFTVVEKRYDGDRISFRWKLWGDGKDSYIPKNRPHYKSYLWDGNDWYQYYSGSEDEPGRLHLRKGDNQRSHKVLVRRCLDGIVQGGPRAADGGYERVDATLRRADSISVRDRTEEIGGSKCYVIDAVTKYGKYTLWIDPQHGYNIAKMEVVKKGGDLIGPRGSPYQEEGTLLVRLKKVRFKLIGGIWLTVEGTKEANTTNGRGGRLYTREDIKRPEITLNPDPNALGLFLPDDIINGTEVWLPPINSVNYTWQDGEVVDANGRKVDFEKLNKKATKTKNAKPK